MLLYFSVILQDHDTIRTHALNKSGSAESCTHASASGDTLEIMVVGWGQADSSYSITVTWTE